MKKAMQTALLLGLALLAGCAAPGAVSPAPTPELTESPEAGATGPVDSAPWFATFRVVSGAETGELVLAANGGTSGEVCVLNTKDLPLDRPVDALSVLGAQGIKGFRLLPYRAVGVSSGMLLALKADAVKVGKTDYGSIL